MCSNESCKIVHRMDELIEIVQSFSHHFFFQIFSLTKATMHINFSPDLQTFYQKNILATFNHFNSNFKKISCCDYVDTDVKFCLMIIFAKVQKLFSSYNILDHLHYFLAWEVIILLYCFVGPVRFVLVLKNAV